MVRYELDVPTPAPTPESDVPQKKKAAARLVSLDAYRGFVMLLMASSGFAIWNTFQKLAKIPGWYESQSQEALSAWGIASYQLSHVEWTGCGLWDMIQPSFMFMVGVAMPYSYAKRAASGDSAFWRTAHMLFRALVLTGLGVFLASMRGSQTNFLFTNVLAQIGLAYPFVYLFNGRSWRTQLAGIIMIFGGYWAFFAYLPLPEEDTAKTQEYVGTVQQKPESEWKQFDGFAAHWNKHTNAGAWADRHILNWFPRSEEEWNGKQYWVNNGGYVTLNFVPSIITMLFGLMAGQLMRSEKTNGKKLKTLIWAGAVCLIVPMAMDTTIWPVSVEGMNWSLCPVVKKIWTPTWAVFSAGWCFWMLGGFFLVIDMWGFKRLAFPLAIVGMNSIFFYMMAQMIKGWVESQYRVHLGTVDIWVAQGAEHLGLALGEWKGFVYYLFSDDFVYSEIVRRSFTLFCLWCITLWMYRRKIFIRV